MDMPRESWELMTTLADADPAAPTACSSWTVHDLVAHLAAGAKENADLIEDALAGRQQIQAEGGALAADLQPATCEDEHGPGEGPVAGDLFGAEEQPAGDFAQRADV